MPVSPHMPPCPPPPPGTTDPVPSPVRRPSPLYPKVSSRKESVWEPPMNGRDPDGTSTVSATHQPDASRIEPMETAASRSLRLHGVGENAKRASAKPGTMRSTWNCLVRNPRPTRPPASASSAVLARFPPREAGFASARRTQSAASVMSSTSRASGLLNRNVSAATGVVTNRAPASTPNHVPQTRRAIRKTMNVVATPMIAWGSRIEKELSPNRRTESAMSQMDAGGLSTVMAFDGVGCGVRGDLCAARRPGCRRCGA